MWVFRRRCTGGTRGVRNPRHQGKDASTTTARAWRARHARPAGRAPRQGPAPRGRCDRIAGAEPGADRRRSREPCDVAGFPVQGQATTDRSAFPAAVSSLPDDSLQSAVSGDRPCRDEETGRQAGRWPCALCRRGSRATLHYLGGGQAGAAPEMLVGPFRRAHRKCSKHIFSHVLCRESWRAVAIDPDSP